MRKTLSCSSEFSGGNFKLILSLNTSVEGGNAFDIMVPNIKNFYSNRTIKYVALFTFEGVNRFHILNKAKHEDESLILQTETPGEITLLGSSNNLSAMNEKTIWNFTFGLSNILNPNCFFSVQLPGFLQVPPDSKCALYVSTQPNLNYICEYAQITPPAKIKITK